MYINQLIFNTFTFLLTVISIINLLLFFHQKRNKRRVFINIFESATQPVLIIHNKSKQILWFNDNFKIYFPNIFFGDSIDKLKPKFLLKTIQITCGKNEWVATNINLNSETGIVLTLTNKTDFKWWLDLPFPTAILTQNHEIEDENAIFKELIDKSQYKNNIEEFKNIIELAKHNQKQEMILYSSDGIYPAKIWISPLEEKYLIFIESRIEYIKLKNKAQESQHLQILGQLTSGIIHDFNNLLTCMCGFAESLEEKIPNDENIKQIKYNIEQASNLSNELLNFIKEKPIENKIIEPKLYIPKMQNMLKKLLGEKIKLEITSNTEGKIKISETQLERILLNMVINSKDAMSNGGLFKITTHSEEITNNMKAEDGNILKAGHYYIINVIDNGSGISPQHIPKVFQTFFTTKKRGTGLGLSSCLKIAEHAGGTIKLTTSNKGTMFSIILPLVDQSLDDVEKNKKAQNTNIIHDTPLEKNNEIIFPSTTTSKKVIILVEDEEPIRNLVKKALESDYEIHDYGDGMEALKAIKNIYFDCLITDAVLPEVDGIKLANEAVKVKKDAKIFIVSGYDLDTIKDQIPENTVYIGKPFTLKKLKDIVSSNLN